MTEKKTQMKGTQGGFCRRVFVALFFFFASVMCARAAEMPEVHVYHLGDYQICEPYARVQFQLGEESLHGVLNLFLKVDALRVSVEHRSKGDPPPLTTAETQVYPSNWKEFVHYTIVWQGREYAFDAWGAFIIDRRHVYNEEHEIVSRLEVFFRSYYSQTSISNHPDAVLLKSPLKQVSSLPVFAGFEDARYQAHDALILKLVKEFNDHPEKALGAAEGTVLDLPLLDPALIKAMMIEETGGNGPRSTRAWKKDPMQVNVPGDWSNAKKALGLKKPSSRNEGSLEQNIRAGIAFLARKGYGVSGTGLEQRPKAYFDSWRVALQRYNGRTSDRMEGVSYAEAYAKRILRRVMNPRQFVPISTDKYDY